MDLKTRYVVKGIGKEQIIQSQILIHMNGDKISKVEDKWDGKLPDGVIANVSFIQLLNPLWWANYTWAWIFYLWSFVWWTWPWRVRTASFCSASKSGIFKRHLLIFSSLQAFRNLNSVTVPKIISVPKNKEEDAARGN